MTARNVLIIMTDEHAPAMLGCAGHPVVQTPNIDKLAAAGTRFTRAYSPSPVCVPARAAFATGQWVHQTRCWSNAEPYHGQIPGWGRRLIDEGHQVVSIGKLHYRSKEDDNGFSEEFLPLHVRGGVGFERGLLRRQYHQFETAHFADEIGPGEDPYSDYDRRVAEAAVNWLKTEGASRRQKPWVLFVSFLRPHYPLTCPKAFYDLYPLEKVPPRRFVGAEVEFRHPVLAAMRDYYDYDDYFDDHGRQVARASYMGLCSFVDDLTGKVMAALEASGAANDTAVVYTSDHGDLVGDHGLWTKMVMYEGAAGIPLILSGAGAPRGVSDTPASLVDIHQTVLEATGLGLSEADKALPGRALQDLVLNPDPQRTVLSEYHDAGAITGMFMIRWERWKYVCYPNFDPQLFDLESDPHEEHDLVNSADHREILTACHNRLLAICDPDEQNARCFADQALRIEELGGAGAILARESFDFTPVE